MAKIGNVHFRQFKQLKHLIICGSINGETLVIMLLLISDGVLDTTRARLPSDLSDRLLKRVGVVKLMTVGSSSQRN